MISTHVYYNNHNRKTWIEIKDVQQLFNLRFSNKKHSDLRSAELVMEGIAHHLSASGLKKDRPFEKWESWLSPGK